MIKYNGNIEAILSKLRVKIRKSEAKIVNTAKIESKHKVLKNEKMEE